MAGVDMPTLRLDADARKGVKAFEDLTKAIDKTEQQLELTSREAKKLETAAGRIAKQNEGPQERYNRKMQELATLVKQGKLSMEQAEVAASRYGKQLDRAGQSSEQAFGATAIAKLSAMAGGFFTLTGAVGAYKQALQEAEQASQQVAESFFQGLGAIGELQQVSGSPEDFRKNLGFARSLVRRGVFTEIGDAADFAFATTSAGYSDEEKEYLAKIGERKQVRSSGLTGFASGARKVQGLFDGASLATAGDKLLAASGFTQANLTQTAEAVPKLTAAAKALGYDPDTVLAGLVGNEEAAANIDVGTTQFASFLAQVSKRGLSTGTLEGTIQSIDKRVKAGENIYSILGEEGAVKGFGALSGGKGREDYIASLASIRGSKGALANRNFLASDPATSAASFLSQTSGEYTDALGDRAPIELLLDAMVKHMLTRNRDNAINAFAVRRGSEFMDAFGAEEHYIRSNLWQTDKQFQDAMLKQLEILNNNIAGGTTKQE